jgi:hypothetical protein
MLALNLLIDVELAFGRLDAYASVLSTDGRKSRVIVPAGSKAEILKFTLPRLSDAGHDAHF